MRGHWRIRKRVRVGKLIALNLTRQSVSVSLGWRGFTLNLSARGIYVTLSARGTGVSYRVGAPWKRWLKRDRIALEPPDQDSSKEGDEPWTR